MTLSIRAASGPLSLYSLDRFTVTLIKFVSLGVRAAYRGTIP